LKEAAGKTLTFASRRLESGLTLQFNPNFLETCKR